MVNVAESEQFGVNEIIHVDGSEIDASDIGYFQKQFGMKLRKREISSSKYNVSNTFISTIFSPFSLPAA